MLRNRSLIALLLLGIYLLAVVSAQDTNNPKRERFGSNLKRLKWDPKTHTAVDTKEKDKPKRTAGEILGSIL